MQRKIVFIAVGLAVLSLLVVAVNFVSLEDLFGAGDTYSRTNTPSVALQRINSDFALAMQYQRERKYDLALQSYKKALLSAEDSIQEAQIQYRIALVTELRGNYVEAIRLFKSIAADPSNYELVRAYSVQEIGRMYYTYYDDRSGSQIPTETFKDTPYNSFKEESGDMNLAYRKLFEYAASMYPLGVSEARIAHWYSTELLKQATTTTQSISYVSIVRENIRKAEADIQRTIDDPPAAALIPETYMRIGLTLANLASVGAASFEEAEQRLQQALQYTSVLGTVPGNFQAYSYAAFLASTHGKTRAADIQNILSPFSTSRASEIMPIVVNFYRAARTDPTLVEQRKQLVLLGQIDTDFKTYLVSLGWHESDF